MKAFTVVFRFLMTITFLKYLTFKCRLTKLKCLFKITLIIKKRLKDYLLLLS